MLMLSWIFKLNNYIFKFYGFLYRPPPGNETISISFRYIIPFILGGSIMDEYLKQYREMISLRGLTDHTIISYSTYIRAYLKYLSEILHKLPEDVSWAELRDFIRWLQKEKQLSDRTVNHCISHLRFFTMYVLHRPWDPTQLPMRRFDTYLPYVFVLRCSSYRHLHFLINLLAQNTGRLHQKHDNQDGKHNGI